MAEMHQTSPMMPGQAMPEAGAAGGRAPEPADEAGLDWQENRERPVGETRKLNALLWAAYVLATAVLGGATYLGWLLFHH
jgi:hypothetical protein